GEALVADLGVRARGLPHPPRHAEALRDPERDVVEDRESAEQLVDLERAPEHALHARRLADAGDVCAAEEDAARRRSERTGEHVHESGLARAVRPDERVPRSRLEPEVDPVRDREGAEALAQGLRLERGAHARLRSRRTAASTIPRMPPRANITTTISMAPMPRYQYSGNCFARKSCATRYASGPTKAP